MYEEAPPPGPLRGVARCVWRSASAAPKRIVPDGCVDLVAGDGEVFVAGPDTSAWSSVTRPGAVLTGVRLVPGRAAAVLGVAADELRDRRVPVGELWGEQVAERMLAGELSPAQAIAARLREVPPPDPAVAALIARLDAGAARVAEAAAGLERAGAAGERAAAAALGRLDATGTDITAVLSRPGATRTEITTALGRLGASGTDITAPLGRPDATGTDIATPLGRPGASGTDITTALAQASARRAEATATRVEDPTLSRAIGERRLRRRFVQAVGYGPATYLRVSRFQRAVALAAHVPSLASLAAAAGYADQAHLSRDCRALTGLTPRAYFR